MAEIIRMPKMSDTMTEGIIAAWHKKVGEPVKSGELLAEIETDKATMDFESPEGGTLLHIGPKEKEAVAIDGILAIIGKAGEDISSLLEDKPSNPPANSAQPIVTQQPETKTAEKPVADTPGKPETSEPPPAKTEDIPVSKIPENKTPEKPTAPVNAQPILMPKLTDTMTEGTLVKWHKKIGDTVKSNDLLAEIETDKATMDFESPEGGTLLYIGVEAGNPITPGAILAIVGDANADFQTLLKGDAPAAKEEEKTADTTQNTVSLPVNGSATQPSNGQHDEKIKISPLAKVLAEEKGYNIQQIKGSGPEGRIIKKDVESFVATQPATEKVVDKPADKPVEKQEMPKPQPVVAGQDTYEDVPLSQMRKVIARRLAECMYSAHHF
ncbi:MAG: E3 binding domain-containing protein, partial [Verrucomicrobia bacterium]|nr:E3 binding domain-containing protein [Cytophagales bacterium]